MSPSRLFTAAVIVLAACRSSAPPSAPAEAPAPVAAAAERCPVGELAPVIAVDDHAYGATISFVSKGAPDRLRGHVFALADVHNEVHAEMGPLPDEDDAIADATAADELGERNDEIFAGPTGAAPPEPAPADDAGAAFLSVHSRARPEQIRGGAQIVFIGEPDDVEELREELRERAAEITAECAYPPEEQP